MIKIIWDEGFKRKYKKIIKNNLNLKDKFWELTYLFEKEPFDNRLKTHKLTGKLKGLWAFRIDYDCRVVFKFINSNEVLFIDIGGHDEVY